MNLCRQPDGIYFSARYRQLSGIEHLKVFADEELAEKWFSENDVEGVAFEYEVIGS